MIRLPSGQLVALSSERARLHALRLGLRVDRDTPWQQLLGLVDILFLDAPDSVGCKASARRFTGYTLADSDWLARWRTDDRAALTAWLRERPQRQRIESARHRVMYDSLPRRIERHAYPDRLYSCLARRVAALPMNRASVAQWRATLVNLTASGIRRDELEWSGVLEFLDATDARRKLHRDDIQRRIGFPGLQLVLSTELTGAGAWRLPFQERARLERWRGERVRRRAIDRAFGYRILLLGHAAGQPQWQAIDPDRRAIGSPRPSFEAACAAASAHATARHGLRAPALPSDRYAYLALAGGEDYREWLLTLPEFPASCFTPHFTERNLLLHFRTTRRVDAQGNPLLFVEEIQSDWHQGRAPRPGTAPWEEPAPRAPFAREWLSLALKLILLRAVDEGAGRVAWVPGWVVARRFGCAGDFFARHYDRAIPQLLERLSSPWAGAVGTTHVVTREPWLCMRRHGDHWRVASADGRFATRRPLSREQALALIRRHAKRIELEVASLAIPEAMREALLRDGLPLFGETLESVAPCVSRRPSGQG